MGGYKHNLEVYRMRLDISEEELRKMVEARVRAIVNDEFTSELRREIDAKIVARINETIFSNEFLEQIATVLKLKTENRKQ